MPRWRQCTTLPKPPLPMTVNSSKSLRPMRVGVLVGLVGLGVLGVLVGLGVLVVAVLEEATMGLI